MLDNDSDSPRSRDELRTDGLYSLPVIGEPAAKARRFFDEVGPQPGDSAGVIASKRAMQVGVIVVSAGAIGTIVL